MRWNAPVWAKTQKLPPRFYFESGEGCDLRGAIERLAWGVFCSAWGGLPGASGTERDRQIVQRHGSRFAATDLAIQPTPHKPKVKIVSPRCQACDTRRLVSSRLLPQRRQ